jgi:hypothetical protein
MDVPVLAAVFLLLMPVEPNLDAVVVARRLDPSAWRRRPLAGADV